MLVLAAVLITAGTGLVARTWINSQRVPVAAPAAAPAPVVVPKTEVLVATIDLPAGTFLNKAHLRWQSWPDRSLPESYFVKPGATKGEDPAASLGMLGAVVRRGISAGEPIVRGRVLKPGDRGFLAAVLRPGYRAMAVKVNATTGISGLIFPGDRVDLILTHTIKRGETERRASETVLTNVRVLAIDQVLNDQSSDPKLGKNATLELTPKQSEMLAVLRELGTLSLALRSLAKDEEELDRLVNSDEPLAEPDPARGTTYTYESEVSRLLRRPSGNQSAKDVVTVTRGGESQELKFPKK